jgi:hypothetical protein
MSPRRLPTRLLKLCEVADDRRSMFFPYPRYESKQAAVFAVLTTMIRLDWTQEDALRFMTRDGRELRPLFVGYLYAYTDIQNVFGVPEQDRVSKHPERDLEQTMLFFDGEWERAKATVTRERAPLEALAQYEFSTPSKVNLSRLAVLRVNLLMAARYGPIYGLGLVELTEQAQLSRNPAIAAQHWFVTSGLLSCPEPGSWVRGKVARWELHLPRPAHETPAGWFEYPEDRPGSDVNSSDLDHSLYRKMNLGMTGSFHSLGLKPHALPWEHPAIPLGPIHPIWRALGKLPWFIYERLSSDAGVVLPPWLDRTAREMATVGLAKRDLDGRWRRVAQDLDVLHAALKAQTR